MLSRWLSARHQRGTTEHGETQNEVSLGSWYEPAYATPSVVSLALMWGEGGGWVRVGGAAGLVVLPRMAANILLQEGGPACCWWHRTRAGEESQMQAALARNWDLKF